MEHCFKTVQPKKVRQVLEKSTQSTVRSLHGLRFGVTPLKLKRSFHHSTSFCSSVDILGISVVDRNVCLATRLRSISCQSILLRSSIRSFTLHKQLGFTRGRKAKTFKTMALKIIAV